MAATTSPAIEAQQQPGCWSKHWKKIIGCGCLTILAGGAAFIAFILLVVVASMKSSDAFTESLAMAQFNPEVTEALGNPVKAGMFVSGNVNVSGGTGRAAIRYSISGPKGKGTVDVEGDKHAGLWSWTLMQVTLKDGTVINLIESPQPPEPGMDEPPPEPPVESPPGG